MENTRIAKTMTACAFFAFAVHSFAFYSPQMGRWITRDPIGEEDTANLYQFVENNPVKHVDYLGAYTLGDAEDSLIKKGVPKGIRTWHGDRYSDVQLFNEWLVMERSRGVWWTSLPKCPSRLCIRKDGTAANPDPTKWKDPEKPMMTLRIYHPGGVYEMRSLPVGGHGNQCVYDAKGSVLVGPPSGGTVDWWSPDSFFNAMFRHRPHDVVTYELGKGLGRVADYYSVRPSW